MATTQTDATFKWVLVEGDWFVSGDSRPTGPASPVIRRGVRKGFMRANGSLYLRPAR